MAIVAQRVFDNFGGQIHLDVYYDDLTNVAQEIRFANLSPYRVRYIITRPNKESWLDGWLEPGTPETTYTLQKRWQWNVQTGEWPQLSYAVSVNVRL